MNTSSPDFTTVLNSAAKSVDRPTASAMVAALQTAEITARTQKLAIPFAALLGEWRLCFATGASKTKGNQVKLGRGYYLPKFIPASIAFTQDADSELTGTVTNKLLVGSIYIRFTGPCRYPGKKNLLVFDFTEIQLKFLGVTVYQGKIRSGKAGIKDFAKISIADLPFFAFFWAGETSIAARGRGGGLAVWVRDE
ncbi:hypothetical protein [Chamaesiphon sp. OTE_8_metabat_110]|uniref:hypothetical protein n=1 Tax=Chamaesiphon sp. OTE_8_metabat_110 TaxID=2964696 RepID=UPI00286A18AE|nr:hypothetical protein [Chamaesiphon sp. OTE_8_metabat_110]